MVDHFVGRAPVLIRMAARLRAGENLAVEGRSSMNKDQLIEVIAERSSVPDDTGARVIDLVEDTEAKLGQVANRVKRKVRHRAS